MTEDQTDSIEAILRPFARVGDELAVRIELGGKRRLGRPSATIGGPRLTRDLEADGRFVGRLVAEGPAVSQRSVVAALEALAVAVERILVVPPREGVSDSSGSDPRSGMAAELALSRLQQRSIVSLEPPDVPGYDLASYYEPAREIGGDFFELFRLRRRGRPLGIVIADVTGKGIAAALLMAFARPVMHCRAAGSERACRRVAPDEPDPGRGAAYGAVHHRARRSARRHRRVAC